MDPEQTLREIRELIAKIQGHTDHRTPWDEYAQDLAEKVEALDGWLRKGGFLPKDWAGIWEDSKDQWSEEISQVHPTRSGSHEEYAQAMQMVGNRHSKFALVALVNWLLVRLKKDGK